MCALGCLTTTNAKHAGASRILAFDQSFISVPRWVCLKTHYALSRSQPQVENSLQGLQSVQLNAGEEQSANRTTFGSSFFMPRFPTGQGSRLHLFLRLCGFLCCLPLALLFSSLVAVVSFLVLPLTLSPFSLPLSTPFFTPFSLANRRVYIAVAARSENIFN